jgi:hypothetical protein
MLSLDIVALFATNVTGNLNSLDVMETEIPGTSARRYFSGYVSVNWGIKE